MASYADVLLNNESLKEAGSGLTAVFVGGTAGIGLGALRSLTKHTASPTIYIVGRSRSKLDPLMAELRQLNDTATFHGIEAPDLTLVRCAQDAAEEIAKRAERVDLLIMSTGYQDFSRNESPEGLDRLTALRYYSRMRFLVTLAPLLQKSPSPRVVSVLGSGNEGTLDVDDLLLTKGYGVIKAAIAAGTMTTLFLEQWSQRKDMEKVVFIHVYPGVVGDTALTLGPNVPGWAKWLVDWILGPMMRLMGYTAAEAGERVIFAATNGRFRRLEEGRSGVGTLVQQALDGKVGGGLYLVQADSSVKTQNAALKKQREEGVGKIVFDHTLEVFDQCGEMKGGSREA